MKILHFKIAAEGGDQAKADITKLLGQCRISNLIKNNAPPLLKMSYETSKHMDAQDCGWHTMNFIFGREAINLEFDKSLPFGEVRLIRGQTLPKKSKNNKKAASIGARPSDSPQLIQSDDNVKAAAAEVLSENGISKATEQAFHNVMTALKGEPTTEAPISGSSKLSKDEKLRAIDVEIKSEGAANG